MVYQPLPRLSRYTTEIRCMPCLTSKDRPTSGGVVLHTWIPPNWEPKTKTKKNRGTKFEIDCRNWSWTKWFSWNVRSLTSTGVCWSKSSSPKQKCVSTNGSLQTAMQKPTKEGPNLHGTEFICDEIEIVVICALCDCVYLPNNYWRADSMDLANLKRLHLHG